MYSSAKAIMKYVGTNNKLSGKMLSFRVCKALSAGIKSGTLKHPKTKMGAYRFIVVHKIKKMEKHQIKRCLERLVDLLLFKAINDTIETSACIRYS